MGRQIKELTGDKIGEWTVLGEAGRKNGGVLWSCSCSCGNIEVLTSSTLSRRNRLMCKTCKPAPIRTKDITGNKYHMLTAVRHIRFDKLPSGKNTAIWEFSCECGNTKTMRARNAISGRVKSCGCLQTQASDFDTKLCPICEITKPREEFNKNKSLNKKGTSLQGKCRDCQKKAYKEYYARTVAHKPKKTLVQKPRT